MHRRSQDRQTRAPKTQLHSHCESCYSARCKKKVDISVSCVLSQCRFHCGTHYHLCKEEEHMLLCPNVSVPCLNAEYGCPNSMPRSKQAEHLANCPASVVCCSMEWLRWPANDTHPHNTITLQDNVLREKNEGRTEALDLATALVDQTELYGRLRMKQLYPEQMDEDDEDDEEKGKEEKTRKEEERRKEEEKRKEEEMAKEEDRRRKTPGLQLNLTMDHASHPASRDQTVASSRADPVSNESSDAGKEPDKQGTNTRTYNLMERMFSMDRGQCAISEASLNEQKATSGGGGGEEGKEAQEEGRREGEAAAGGAAGPSNGPSAGPYPPQDSGSSPWHEGVLERLEQTLSPKEYNMYLAHHGRMLLHFGQIAACTPRDKDFVYGSLEPIPVQTLHSFKVPTGYRFKHRVCIKDTLPKGKTEVIGVDTSDLEVNEEAWYSDEADSTLLGYAELEALGHEISESKGVDGAYVDEGTQTHLFHKAPFKRRTTLADVMADRPLRLRLQLQTECISTRNHSGNSRFTFRCGHSFHRNELPAHFRNVHSEIQMGLNSWFEERCPLAYLGCTYSQRRFQPSTHKANVTYNKELRCFNLRPVLPAVLEMQEPPSTQTKRAGRAGGGTGQDTLSSLPYEVLCHMAIFLDSMSLSQLALVSHLMREVCSSLLQDRGMVTLHWEKKTSSHGGVKWNAKPVWQFSHLFSQVDSWHVTDIHSMSAHLKVCPYNETCPRTERIPLPGMMNQQTDEERQTLVKQFSGSRL